MNRLFRYAVSVFIAGVMAFSCARLPRPTATDTPLVATGPLEAANDPERLRDRIITTATGFLGIPYVWGSASPDKGFDCSGFTMEVFRRHGVELPRSAAGQFRVGEPVPRNALQKGDLLFFATGRKNRISHVGIYSGNDSFIHASTHEARICTANLSKSYYRKRYKGARRMAQLQ